MGIVCLGWKQRALLVMEFSSSSQQVYQMGYRFQASFYSAQSSGEIFFLKMELSIPALKQQIIIIQTKLVKKLSQTLLTIQLILKDKKILFTLVSWIQNIQIKVSEDYNLTAHKMDDKLVQLLSNKMKQGQVLLDLVPIMFFSLNGTKCENKLGISSKTFYFIHNSKVKKQIAINSIKMVTLSTFSQEIVLHSEEDDVRVTSYQNAKIFKNILKVREMVLKNSQPFTVLLERQRHLGKYAGEQDKKKGFFSGLFSKLHNPDKKYNSMSSNRKSFCKLMVSDKTFLKEISSCIYECHNQTVQLLYISGGYTFFFDQKDYKKEEIDPQTYIFSNQFNKETFIMHKIRKTREEENKVIREYLQNFKLKNNQVQIYYATESAEYFQVISPFTRQQRSLEVVLSHKRQISEIDLASIFYKMVGLIMDEDVVFCSLQPKYIILKESIQIASVLCINPSDINLNYLAPEELDPQIVVQINPQLINLWKVGILLFELAFESFPFPIQHLAELIVHNKPLKMHYPHSNRSPQFRQFLNDILQIQANRRGGGQNWKQNVLLNPNIVIRPQLDKADNAMTCQTFQQ